MTLLKLSDCDGESHYRHEATMLAAPRPVFYSCGARLLLAPSIVGDPEVIGALRQNGPILPVASFRTWRASRPDEEHWELIDGVPRLAAPVSRRHQRIASNLESLLNIALNRHDPVFVAYLAIGVNIASTVPYDLVPDVTVIREEENPDPRYAERFYLVAEVLSDSDKDIIESKREIYRAQQSCTCILLVHQDRVEIIVERRTADDWRAETLGDGDQLTLPELGLTCPVKDIYRNTPLG